MKNDGLFYHENALEIFPILVLLSAKHQTNVIKATQSIVSQRITQIRVTLVTAKKQKLL